MKRVMTKAQVFLRSSEDLNSKINLDDQNILSQIILIGETLGKEYGKKYQIDFGEKLGVDLAESIYQKLINTNKIKILSQTTLYCPHSDGKIPIIKKSKHKKHYYSSDSIEYLSLDPINLKKSKESVSNIKQIIYQGKIPRGY